jgi:GSCFA family
MSGHPYTSLPDHCFWRRSVAAPPAEAVDPVVRPAFRITREDRVATAGSCFAQHIARHLERAGFAFLVTETAHPLLPRPLAERFGYGLFTARYGNIYTSRQLKQLLQRAWGLFCPVEDVWIRPDGRLIDPFRPQIQPNGFATDAEYRADRDQHFAAVRRAVEEMDVFVFTLGLTETWVSRIDGATYPLCPGVAGGSFDPERHAFHNLGVNEVIDEMLEAIAFIRERNPRVRIILTVSPVPLIATALDRSVLVSTSYSKAVLRVACEEITARVENAAYFPSYEIITGPQARGRHYARDLRSITEAGVERVMRLFLTHYTDFDPAADGKPRPLTTTQPGGQWSLQEMERVVAVMCDEEALDQTRPTARPAARPMAAGAD